MACIARNAPYVGVSGFMRRDEASAALDAFPDCGRLLMVGVLVSGKTLAGQPNKYPRRYPKVEDIAGIFIDDPRCLNLVHVSLDEIGTWPKDILETAMRAGGPLCDGIQLNTPYPSTPSGEGALSATLRCFRDKFPEARLVFQIRPDDETALELAARACYVVGKRARKATDILIDASGGAGLGLDIGRADDIIAATQRHARDIGYGPACIGVAGGLCAETLPDVGPLLAARPGLSIDAEGRLRDGADGGANLDLGKVRAYLAAAA
jgi:hypothetical protein